jgi:hypothetical protein
MDTARQFLRSVLPVAGRYCVVSIKNKQIQQFFSDDLTELLSWGTAESQQAKNVFFGLSAFDGANQRTAYHSLELQSFFLDLDVGAGKQYASALDAENAIVALCRTTGLPPPTLVQSGYGLHVYWPLLEPVPTEQWLPIALRFKQFCTKQGVGFDPVVPADPARILRLPETFNYKVPEDPRAVRVLRTAGAVDLSEFVSVIAEHVPRVTVSAPAAHAPPPVSPLMQALTGNHVARFSVIVRRSLQGAGCNAIRHIVQHQAEISEPLWFSGLSIAQHCEDRDVAIHKMSRRHPAYDPKETEAKASGAAYPHTCETFRQRAPDLCAGCPLSVKSPIVLGHVIAEAPAQEPPAEEVVCTVELTPETLDAVKKPAPVVFNPPSPYFRGMKGGIYKREKGEGGEFTDTLVYEHDFYATQRLNDPNYGEVVVFKLILPQDGEREFSIPLAELHSPEKFRAVTGRNGIAAGQAQMRLIMSYAIKYAKDLQVKMQAREARLQFGWTTQRDGFVAGNRVYKASSALHNPASSATSDIIHFLSPVGELDVWRSIINALAKPGMEPLQFAALCGFGSPLMPFTGVAGVTVNLLSNASGTGKTTACQIANSVFGHPVHTMIIERDTQNAREHKMGVMNHLCVVADEMTNIQPEALSDMVYAASQGRGKDRMDGQTNRLRANTTRWQLILLTNSNSSMVSKLAKNKARPDGELMRLVELPVQRVVVDGGDDIFNKLHTNYGVAGPIYAQWLVRYHASLQQLMDKEKAKLWKQVGKRIEERHVVGTVAAVLLGGRIAQRLGLHDLDVDNLARWAAETLLEKRKTFTAEVTDTETLLGEFINANHTAIVGVNKNKLSGLTGTTVFYTPRSNAVVGRLEVGDPAFIFISRKAFRDYCVERQYTMNEVLQECSNENTSFQYIGAAKKRLLSGSGMLAPSVDTLQFLCAPDETAALEEALNKHAKVES